MPTITTFDAPSCRTLRPLLDDALARLGAELGITLTAGTMRFDRSGATASITVQAEIGDAAGAADRAAAQRRAEWDRHCGLFELTPADFGASILLNGKPYTLAGLPSGRSRKMQLERDGKTYTAPIATVLTALGRPVPPFWGGR